MQWQTLEARLPAQNERAKERVALRQLILQPEPAPMPGSVATTSCSERRCSRQTVARDEGTGWVSCSSRWRASRCWAGFLPPDLALVPEGAVPREHPHGKREECFEGQPQFLAPAELVSRDFAAPGERAPANESVPGAGQRRNSPQRARRAQRHQGSASSLEAFDRPAMGCPSRSCCDADGSCLLICYLGLMQNGALLPHGEKHQCDGRVLRALSFKLSV